MKRPAGPESPWWLRWTRAALALTVLATPLIFDVRSIDAFARAKLAVLHLMVPLAAVGPIAGLVLGDLRARIRPTWADLAAVVFAALAVIATLVAPDPRHAVEGEPLQYQGLVSLLMYVAAFFIARVAFAHGQGLGRFFGVLTIALAIVAAYGIAQQLGFDPIWHGLDKGRIFSSLGQANNLGAFLVLALPCAVVLAAWGRPASRVAAGAAALLGIVALGLTLSRGGYLAVFAAALVMGVALLPRLRLDRRRLGAALLVVAATVVVVFAVPAARQQVERVADRVASSVEFGSSSIASHLDLWTVGFWITVDHPVVGIGPDSYALEFPDYRDRVLAPSHAAVLARFRPESPHNEYLAISAGLGVPALAAYLALIAGALARVVGSLRAGSVTGSVRLAAVALLGAIVAHLVSDAFMTAELTGSWLFWSFLGAAVSLPMDVPGPAAEKGEGPGRPRTPRPHR